MRAAMLIVFVGLVGCATQDGLPWFTWQPGTTPHAVLADGSEDPVWTVMVDRAHEKWAVALAGVGCADPRAHPRWTRSCPARRYCGLACWCCPCAGQHAAANRAIVSANIFHAAASVRNRLDLGERSHSRDARQSEFLLSIVVVDQSNRIGAMIQKACAQMEQQSR